MMFSSGDEGNMAVGETCPHDREDNWVTKKLTNGTKRTAVCLLADLFCLTLGTYFSHIAKMGLLLIFGDGDIVLD